MTPKSEYGQTAAAPVNILPELPIDMSDGQALSPVLGKTEVPVHVLPELALDFGPTVPALHLQLTFRPGVPASRVSCDLFRLYAAVNQLDVSLNGAGLSPVAASCEEHTADGTLSVTFKPGDPDGAGERLARIASAVKVVSDYPSLASCEAKVVSIAA
jgi:hypothetical protein